MSILTSRPLLECTLVKQIQPALEYFLCEMTNACFLSDQQWFHIEAPPKIRTLKRTLHGYGHSMDDELQNLNSEHDRSIVRLEWTQLDSTRL